MDAFWSAPYLLSTWVHLCVSPTPVNILSPCGPRRREPVGKAWGKFAVHQSCGPWLGHSWGQGVIGWESSIAHSSQRGFLSASFSFAGNSRSSK